MASWVTPPYDAEKASTEQVRANYRTPPGTQREFGRGTLVVGRRGVGKTLLLRYHRHTFDGLALYGDLFKILTAIASDTGAGGLTFDISSDLEPLIVSKTNALLAYWIMEGAYDSGANLSWDALQRVLPASLRSTVPTGSDVKTELDGLYARLFRAPLDDFTNDESSRGLDALIGSLSEMANGRLLLLLDRAELVPSPCITSVFRLMDQSAPCTTVIASRPGILGQAFTNTAYRPAPGDHFNLWHLGSHPYSEDWQDFVAECLAVWTPNFVESMQRDHLAWVITMSRDSLRTALELTYNSIDQSGAITVEATAAQLEVVQRMLLQAAEGELADVHSDLAFFLADVRRRTRRASPVLLKIRDGRQQLFHERTALDRMIDIALRVGLFAMPHGEAWHPFVQPHELEIPAIYLWRMEDPPWSTTAS